MGDTQAAVASLHAAGDDIELLTEALEKASFLGSTPGDNRQKYRGIQMFMSFACLPRFLHMFTGVLTGLVVNSADCTRCSKHHGLLVKITNHGVDIIHFTV